MPDNDEPIADAVFSRAVAAEHLLVLAGNLALQHGEEVARGALLVAYLVLAERTVGHTAMLEELNAMVARITESPTIPEAVSRWLH
jgi:hypothetical protein